MGSLCRRLGHAIIPSLRRVAAPYLSALVSPARIGTCSQNECLGHERLEATGQPTWVGGLGNQRTAQAAMFAYSHSRIQANQILFFTLLHVFGLPSWCCSQPHSPFNTDPVSILQDPILL